VSNKYERFDIDSKQCY